MHVHRIRTQDIGDERASWECDCGRSGSTAEWKVDLASDKHIDYDSGEKRIDVHGGDPNAW